MASAMELAHNCSIGYCIDDVSAFHKPCMAQLPLSLQAPSPLSFLCHVPHLQCLSPHLIISNQVVLPYQSLFLCYSIHQMKAMLHSLSQDIVPPT